MLFATLALTLAPLACSHDELPPRNATAEAPVGVVHATNATVERPRTDQLVNVGVNLRTACSIDDSTRAPKFDFDSSALSSNDRDVLDLVARCLTTGPLQGRSVSLVGRADPRGEAEYNMNLGEQRAESAKMYLQQLGVAPARMSDTSRGALDAHGHDADTWRLDRRVDVELVN
jgi:peptidoglycan-associated lipoprotein